MKILIRRFKEEDIISLVEILKLNHQYDYPETEGPESLKRVSRCSAAVLLVAEIEKKPCGFIKGIYDGSRAMIHLVSVHSDYKNRGVGKALLEAAEKEMKSRGAPTISVTITEKSESFWKENGFKKLPVFLMLKELQ